MPVKIELARKFLRYMRDAPRFKTSMSYDPPFYDPNRDVVCMRPEQEYESVEVYWATLWHEYIHSTGHESRLARPYFALTRKPQDDETAIEEMIAAHGSIMMLDLMHMYSPFWKQYEDCASKVRSWELEECKTEAGKAVGFILRGYVKKFGENY